MKLCCHFNYPPLYRQSIYKALDENFDVQFMFGREVEYNKKSGIAKLDYSLFKKKPIEFDNKKKFGRFLWRSKLIRQVFSGYDVFIVTGDLSYSYIPFIILCKLLKKRVYGWGHGPKTRRGKLTPIYWWLINKYDGFFSYGENGKKRMIELGYDEKKIHVIYNSLGRRCNVHKNYASKIFQMHFNNSDPILIFVGRLTKQKQLDWLIKVHGQLNREGVKCNLVLIGDGPASSDLNRLAEKLGFSNRIWFFGECYDETKTSELLYNADVCVSPGNVGLTALHSLSYGTPVISHDDFEAQMPEYEVIKENITGALFKKGNYENLKNTIKDWICNNSNRRLEIRENCYRMINDKWNSDNQMDIFKRILLENDK